MYYLDANAFIYPTLYDGPKAAGAETLLRRIVDGDEAGATSALTLDEVVWILSQRESRRVALEQGRRILQLPRLRILDVTAEHTLTMLRYLERHETLSPRDAVHLSVMDSHGIHGIVTDDRDFEAVPTVERHGLETFGGTG